MSTLIKYVVGHTYKPLLEKYLSRKRIYNHNGFKLEIPPEVFHPGFFFSTKLLLQQLERFSLEGKSLLELGAGSGVISLCAAEKGAIVTATDINRIAVDQLKINAEKNGAKVNVLHSDLFEQIPLTQFDFILINPPYYKRDPITELDYAWCCGTKGQYFQQLFKNIGNYMHHNSEVLMVLCDGCDLQMIERFAFENCFELNCLQERKNLVETNFIFRLQKKIHNETSTDPFVGIYIGLRNKEGRLYSDEQVKMLPEIDASHPLATEWKIREDSARELYNYHQFLRTPLDFLEIGCGNGWLSHKLSSIPRCRVTGLDVNGPELDQARRVFGETEMRKFVLGDIRSGVLRDVRFDVIVFAASFQYFEDAEEILNCAIQHLNPGGSVHIIDTFFYKEGQKHAARMRSWKYFRSIGFPEMFGYYFHHSFDDLRNYEYKLFLDPKNTFNRIERTDRMFPWINIEGKK